MEKIVSAEWLNSNLEDDDLILLDASPSSTVQGDVSNLTNVTINRARFFDLKGKFVDKSSVFPNTLPSAEQFEQECQIIGVNKSSKIVVFDNLGIHTSPRVWWMLKIMGHENVAVLDGGLPEWIKQGFGTVDKKEMSYELGNFSAELKPQFVKSYQDIVNNLVDKSFCVIDVRSEGRFNGTAEEPRKSLKSGHILNSVNIPYQKVLKDGKFKSKKELNELFKEKELAEKNLVFSCGSGLTACIVLLACEIAFKEGNGVYDGSWTEWAELQNLKTN